MVPILLLRTLLCTGQTTLGKQTYTLYVCFSHQGLYQLEKRREKKRERLRRRQQSASDSRKREESLKTETIVQEGERKGDQGVTPRNATECQTSYGPVDIVIQTYLRWTKMSEPI